MDVNSVVNNFYSVIFEAFNRFVPLRNCYNSNCQSHYSHKIRRLFSRECTAWKQYRTFRTQKWLAKYKSIASQCRSAIYSHHVDVENKVINSEILTSSIAMLTANLLIKVLLVLLNPMTDHYY